MASGRKDTAVTFLGSVLSGILVLATQSCLAWMLGPDGRGEYAVCLVLATLLTVAFGLGVEMAVVYYVGSKRLALPEAITGGLMWALAGSIPAVGIGYLITCLPIAFVEKAPLSALRLSLVMVPATLGALVFTRALLGLGELILFTVSSVGRAVVVLVGTYALIRFAGWGVHGALVAVILGDVLHSLCILLVLQYRHGRPLGWPALSTLKLLIGYGLRFYVGKLGRQVHFRIGTVVLAFFATTSEVGVFAAGLALMSGIWMLPDTANLVLLPRTTRDEAGRPALVAKGCRFAMASSLAVMIPVLLLAKPLVALVLSSKFLGAVPIMWILALGMLLRSYPKVLASYFNGVGRPGLNSLSILAGLLVNITLLPMLFRHFGLLGAALTLTIAYTVETLLVVYWFVRISGQPLTRLLWFDSSDAAEIHGLLQRIRPGRTRSKTA